MGVGLVLVALLQDSYDEKVVSILKETAKKHVEIGAFYATKSQYAWAMEHHKRAVDFDPDNETAQKKVGNKKVDGQWVKDDNARLKTANEVTDEEKAAKIAIDGAAKTDSAYASISMLWTQAAKIAPADKSDEAWGNVLRYDPDNTAARTKLGFTKVEKPEGLAPVTWQSKAAGELLATARDAVKKADSGKDGTAAMAADGVGIALTKRESGHFRIGAPHLAADRLAALVQHAEAAHAIFASLVGDETILDKVVESVVYQDKAQHEKFVDATIKDPTRNKAAKASSGVTDRDSNERWQGSDPDGTIDDSIVHAATHSLVLHHAGRNPAWLVEGLALFMTRAVKGTNLTSCTGVGGTGAGGGGGGASWRNPDRWRSKLHKDVCERVDPSVQSVFNASMVELAGAKSVKAWSMIEFLMHEHRAKFVEFLNALGAAPAADASGAAAFENVFDFSLDELDDRWRTWVRATYP